MTAALLIDFGSTFTKLRAVDLDKAAIIGAGQGPSTVATDTETTVGVSRSLPYLMTLRGLWLHRSAEGGSLIVQLHYYAP